ncbi:CHAT domain-containing protein [Leptolyngbya boryana CZ1]|uniref:CHAT domain-containing protein n=1 Tax=Leptolyngbya boryana CZ1 TaxID=3060204 RepID=A0AA96WTS7_LEPBY|nr:CHAT domain-containing protein [Leptolyngbya boryana]WNZ44044.1 CHAT domain-containing protein [Leptolyngbya boryana CZ1]
MADPLDVRLTIAFDDPDLDAEEREEEAQKLLAQMKDLDEIESLERVIDPHPPEGNKAIGAILAGMLTAQAKLSDANGILGFLGDRLSNKSFEMEVEANGKKLKVKANGQGELMAALPLVQQFLAEQAASSAATEAILILSANPRETSRLRLDQEVRDIAEGLRRASQRDRFALETRWAVRARDLYRAMLDTKPRIVHFSGHSEGGSSTKTEAEHGSNRKLVPVAGSALGQEGLVLEDEAGNAKFLDGAALANLFKLFADQVECVVLNSCYSEVQATEIVQYIPYVIGMNQEIGDRAAIEFAVGFYDALGAGRSVEFAYELGCSAIRLAGIAEHLTPVLKKNLT